MAVMAVMALIIVMAVMANQLLDSQLCVIALHLRVSLLIIFMFIPLILLMALRVSPSSLRKLLEDRSLLLAIVDLI